MIMKQPILVATEGTESSLGAVRIGAALAQQSERPLHLIAVARPPLVTVAGSLDQVLQPSSIGRARADRLRTAVVSQLQAAEHQPTMPPVVEIAVDSTPVGIVRYAVRIDAGIIIVGRSHRSTAERWLGSETAPRVVHLAHVPVLEVPCEAAVLPRRAVVAVDFSEFSLDAAHATAALIDDGAELHLAHIAWAAANPDWEGERIWEETYRAGAEARLQVLAEELATEWEVRVRTHLLTGDPVTEIFRLADSLRPELIAAGSHGYGYFGRLVMGSVSTQLLRRAECAVLLTPPRSVTVEALDATPAARFGGDPFAVTVPPGGSAAAGGTGS
jgi:nucleotide-binding universal stress UspA family protein